MQVTWVRGVVLVAVLILGGCGPAEISEVESGADRAGGGVRFEALAEGEVVTDRASTGGVSLIDYDGDGDVDLFVTNGYDVSAEQPVPQPNRLYRNDNGVLVAVEQGPMVEDEGFSSGSTWADFDNDGDLDCFVSNQQDQDNFLYRNEGDGNFTRITDGPVVSDGGHSYSAAWVDVDNNGLVDLFVANGGMSHAQVNFVYRNLGGGSFSRVMEGAIVSGEDASCGTAWGDYDDDGDQDVVVTNYRFGTSPVLFRNDGDFEFTAIEGILDEEGFASSAAMWADLDNDGDLDLVVSGVFGLANRLYLNQGGGNLDRIVADAASLAGGNSYALNVLDAENDGDQDLAIANWGSAGALYINNGNGGFTPLEVTRLGMGIAFASSIATGDLNADGLVDIVIGNWPNTPGPQERNVVLFNRSRSGNWLEVQLVGTNSNTAGIGARVEVRTRTGRLVRDVQAHSGWRSQSDLVQHFGLGPNTAVDIVVRWPSGIEDERTGVAANQRILIIEGS
jgi:hypothetical protein